MMTHEIIEDQRQLLLQERLKLRAQGQVVFKDRIESNITPTGYLNYTFQTLHELLDGCPSIRGINVVDTLYSIDGASFRISTGEDGHLLRRPAEFQETRDFFEQ